MTCVTEWQRVRTQLLIIGATLAAALVAAGVAWFSPWPYNIAGCLAAGGLSLLAGLLSRALVGLIQAYQACRDGTEGQSSCTLSSFWSSFGQFTGLLSALSFFVAAAALAVPWIGTLIGAAPLQTGTTCTIAAIGLLTGLASNLAAYNACRAASTRAPVVD